MGAGGSRVKGAVAQEARVDSAIVVDDQQLGNVAECIRARIAGISRQLDERRAGGEAGLNRAAIKSCIASVAEHHDSRLLPLEREIFFFEDALNVVAAAVAIAEIDERS